MQPADATDADREEIAGPAPAESGDRTPPAWRAGLVAAFIALTIGAASLQGTIGPRGTAIVGCVAFFTLAAAASTNLRAVNWRTIGGGIVLQLAVALLVIHGRVTLGGTTCRSAACSRRSATA